MRVEIRIGLALLAAGLIAWLALFFWANYPSYRPFSEPLPLAKGQVLDKSFAINIPDRYDLLVSCKPRGPLAKEDGIDFLNSNHHESHSLRCSFSLAILSSDTTILQGRVDTLKACGLSNDELQYCAAVNTATTLHLSLQKAGTYRLVLRNDTDLLQLSSATPRLDLALNPHVYIERVIKFWVGTIFCILGFLLGLILLASGWYESRRRTSHSE